MSSSGMLEAVDRKLIDNFTSVVSAPKCFAPVFGAEICFPTVESDV